MALHTYSDLVRGADRPVLDPHPVQARLLLTAIGVGTARSRLYLPLVCAILLLPVGLAGHWLAWAGGCLVVVGCWVGMLGVGFAIHLGGVWAGLSPAFADILDAIRGDSPRTQAALIYAPGLALALVGLAAGLAAAGLGAALEGMTMGWLYLALPPLLGLIGGLAARPLADLCYVRATALLTEIDGMFSGLQDAEQGTEVYLEWLARRDPELLRALRQGWRRLRIWPMGAWFLGALGALAGWQASPDAPVKVLLIAGAAVLLLGALPCRLAEGDPQWLDQALSLSRWRVARARMLAAFSYAQGAILPPAFTLWVRHGSEALVVIAQVELLAVVGAVAGAAGASRWRGQALWLYGPASLLLWALAVGRLFP